MRCASFGRGGTESRFWRAWSNWVMDHPVVVLVGTIVVITVFAGPILRIRTNVPTATSLPTSQQARQGYDIVQARFDRGALNPIQVLVTWNGVGAAAQPTAPQNLAALYGVRQAAGRAARRRRRDEYRQSAGADLGPEPLRVLGRVSAAGGSSAPGDRRGGRGGPSARSAAARALLASTTAPGTVLFQVAPAQRPERRRGPGAVADDQAPHAAARLHRARRRPVGRHPRLPVGPLRPLPAGHPRSWSASPTSCCSCCCAAPGCRSKP